MTRILLLSCIALLAGCSGEQNQYRALSGNYDKGAPVVKGGDGFKIFYSPPPGRYQTIGFISLSGAGDLLPELHHLAQGRGANAAVITSQQTDHVGVNTSTITIGLGTPFFALPSYSNSQTRDVYVQKMSATLLKLR